MLHRRTAEHQGEDKLAAAEAEVDSERAAEEAMEGKMRGLQQRARDAEGVANTEKGWLKHQQTAAAGLAEQLAAEEKLVGQLKENAAAQQQQQEQKFKVTDLLARRMGF